MNPTLHRLLALCRLDRAWVRGEGVWLHDANGRRFLDFYAQYGAVILGHNAPPVVDAVRAALAEGEPAMVQPYRAPHAVALAEALGRVMPGGEWHCVFTTSGAETVEAAIKLVRARSGRPTILSAVGSFHGKTLAALAATGQPQHAEGFGPLPPGFEHVPFGDAGALEQRLQRGDVAAVLLEPIQGERGVHVAPPGYLRSVRERCTQHGAALVLDEIQTGLGRTGRLLACQHDEIVPDVLLLAKGLGGGLFPLGAMLASPEWWDDGFGLRHSSTFANNNIACRVGRAVLETITANGFCADVARKGERLLAGLRRLAERCPGVIADVRGRGLLAAIELRPVGGEQGIFVSFLGNHGLYACTVAAALAEETGVLTLPTLGEAPVLRLAPSLIVRDEEIDLALDAIEHIVARLEWSPARTLAQAVGAFADANGRHPTPAPRTVSLPPPVCRTNGRPTYAFLTHPTRLEDLGLTNPGLEEATPCELHRFRGYLAELPPLVVMRAPTVTSASGRAVDGFILGIPWLPEEMAQRGPRQVAAAIVRAVDLAVRLGVQVVGLGGHTTSFSRRGQAVLGRGPAVTTGNALTAGMAFAACCRAAAARNLDLADTVVGIVGARGSVGGLCARLFARARPRGLVLVGNPMNGNAALRVQRQELEWRPGAVTVADLEHLEACNIVVTATGAGRPVLDDVPLSPGTIVCDVARPPDTSPRLRSRPDLLVIEGGLVALPDAGMRFGAGNLVGLPDGVQLACLSETILLTMEGDRRDHGIGDDVPLDEVDHALALAERHGFRLAPLRQPSRFSREPSASVLQGGVR